MGWEECVATLRRHARGEMGEMAASSSLIVLQRISTIWTKVSHGGAGATARNATPEVLELPPLACVPVEGFFLHDIAYREDDNFQGLSEQFGQHEQSDPIRLDCLEFAMADRTLVVTLVWEQSRGAPRRPPFPRTIWSFHPGQWGRVTYNFRRAGAYDWIYEKCVMSIGLFPAYSSRLFLEKEPAYIYRDMASLW
jgi:hypothetical protein